MYRFAQSLRAAAAIAAVLGMTAGCASSTQSASLDHAGPVPAASAPEQDREAILAMAGGYTVNFNFEETLQLDPNATPSEEHHSDGHELVLVLADEPGFISLQHL